LEALQQINKSLVRVEHEVLGHGKRSSIMSPIGSQSKQSQQVGYTPIKDQQAQVFSSQLTIEKRKSAEPKNDPDALVLSQ